jgi:4-amino-4-deoxy-L-arabinose transferase-like glycosyltransferase
MITRPDNRLLARLESPKTLLTLGIVARVLTFCFLRPSNNDYHFGVIQLLVANGHLPLMTETRLADHPPLYYLLAAPFLKVFGSEKAVQFLSLSLSIASLAVLYSLIYRSGLVQGTLSQFYSLIVVCFLPQFVMFTLYVSNDTLAIFLGALIVWQSRRFIQSGGWKEGLLLAILTGLGLLTKVTFLAFVPALLALVVFIYIKRGSLTKACWATGAFLVIVLSIGGYKFIDNFVQFGDPFANSMDLPADWIGEQSSHYMGLRSYLDINLIRLMALPTLRDGGVPSYPVLVYATFFYQYISESNFVGNKHTPSKYLGSLIYAAGIVPTAVFWVGLGGLIKKLPRFVSSFDPRNAGDCGALCLYLAVCLLFSNCALMFAAILKYQVWSIMQARLFFPSLAGAIGAFGAGVEIVQQKAMAASMLKISMMSLATLFGLYLSSEVAYQIALAYAPAIKGVLRGL